MFIGRHGSRNRRELSGYKVVFVPFEAGKPAGAPHYFLTGFIANRQISAVYGRPVGVAFTTTDHYWCQKMQAKQSGG